MSSDLASNLHAALKGGGDLGDDAIIQEDALLDEAVDTQEEDSGGQKDSTVEGEDSSGKPPPYVSVPDEVAAKETEEKEDGESEAETSIIEYVKEAMGEDLGEKYATDDDMLRGLLNARKLVGKREEDAQKWRALAAAPEETLKSWGYSREQAQDIQQAAGQAAQQAAAPPEQAAPAESPEFEDAWMQMVERDENGQIVGTKPGVDPTVASKLRTAEKFATERYRDMIFHPEKIISPMLDRERERIRSEVTASIQSEMQQSQVAEQAWGYLTSEDNKGWIFNNGDINSGLSEEGVRFKDYVEEATAVGHNPNDINGLVKYATDKMALDWQIPSRTWRTGRTSECSSSKRS